MALPQCICAPCNLSYRPVPGLGLKSPRYACRVNFRGLRGHVIRCSSADSGQKPAQADAPSKPVAQPSPSWEHSHQEDQEYLGWEPLDKDYEIDKRKGLFFTGVGLALAVALSVAGYRVYARKGSLHSIQHSIQHSVTSQYIQLKDTILGSKRAKSRDANKPLTREIPRKPSSDELKQDDQQESSRLDGAKAPETQQKKSVSGQDSFPTEDKTKYSDDDDDWSSGSYSESDVESTEEYGLSDSKRRGSADHSTEGQKQLDTDGISANPNPTPTPSSKPAVNVDDKSHSITPLAPKPDSKLPEESNNKATVSESAQRSYSQSQVSEPESKLIPDALLRNAGIAESLAPKITVSAKEAGTTKDSGDTVLSLSATVPKEVTNELFDLLGLETDSKLEDLDATKSESHLVKKSPSDFEQRLSATATQFWSSSEPVESLGIPAPSAPSAASRARSDGIAVPATVDREQEQAVAALQALKVIEPDVEARDICTRREYARWLIAITSALARCRAQRVFPAMYIETLSELAFSDVRPEDPDFPYIQGLAEAGLIASNLSRHDTDQSGRSTDAVVFLPDSPLSRQDLVCWKVALDGHKLQPADKQKLRAQTGFIDFERIKDDALPFLAADLEAGERSVVSATFGYTRRFQPGKPVTKGQAAMALATGEAADVVAGELTRLEADDMAEAAVAAELSLQARAQKNMDDYFNSELKLEKEFRTKAEKNLEHVKSELERVMMEREDQRLSIEGIHAALQAERELLHKFRQDMEDQLKALTIIKTEAGIEKERLEVIRTEAEEGSQALSDSKAQLEVEKQALILARLWAEDEAKKARAHAKLLEEARKRWQVKGIEVKVSKDLDDDNIPPLTWQHSGQETEGNTFLRKPRVQEILTKAGSLKSRIVERSTHLLREIQKIILWFWQNLLHFFQVLKTKGGESLHVAAKRTQTMREISFGHVSKKAQEVQDTTRSAIAGVSAKVSETTAGMPAKVSETTAGVSAKVSEMSAGVSAKVSETTAGVSVKLSEATAGVSTKVSETTSKVTEATRKAAVGFQGEARKLAKKFKS